MPLSKLQSYILATCLEERGRTNRERFYKFYCNWPKKQRKNMVDAVAQSIEGLIKKGLLIGYGAKTAKKNFIQEVRLTPLGQKIAFKINEQSLPGFN